MAGEDVCQPERQDRVRAQAPAEDDREDEASGQEKRYPGLHPVSSRIQSPDAVPRAKVTRMAPQ